MLKLIEFTVNLLFQSGHYSQYLVNGILNFALLINVPAHYNKYLISNDFFTFILTHGVQSM